jgi:hypothetical protein
MNVIHLILIILAFVLFLIATFNVPSRVNLIAAGLASLTLGVFLLPAFGL